MRSIALITVTPDGSDDVAEVLSALARTALEARGIRAHAVPAPSDCVAGAGTVKACRDKVLSALATGAIHAAILPLPAARPPHVLELRDHGLEELGDAAPPARLACSVTDSHHTVRSLLDFADEILASRYSVSAHDLAAAYHR